MPSTMSSCNAVSCRAKLSSGDPKLAACYILLAAPVKLQLTEVNRHVASRWSPMLLAAERLACSSCPHPVLSCIKLLHVPVVEEQRCLFRLQSHETVQHPTILWSCMQGNCTSPVSAVALGLSGLDLIPRKQAQCVLVTDVQLMSLGRQNLWMDNLYIRYHMTNQSRSPYATEEEDSWSLVECSSSECNLWITSTTL
jgi:hypothetical protein